MRKIQETYDIAEFDFLNVLKENHETIKREYNKTKEYLEDWPEKDLYDSKTQKWKFTIFKAHGTWIPELCSLCPGIFFILNSFGDNIFNAGFSVLGPGTELKMHYGENEVCKDHLRVHYVVNANENCGLKINNGIYLQKENEIVIWDDSMFHTGFNYGTTDKVVLLIDIKRPNDLERGVGELENSEEYNDILNYTRMCGATTNEVIERILINNGINCKNALEFTQYLDKFKPINYQKKDIKNILITGSNGFIGAHCVKYLKNYNLFCVCRGGFERLNKYYKFYFNEELSNEIKVIDMDLSNKDDYIKLPNNIDLIVHTAALDSFKVNINKLWLVNTMPIMYFTEHYSGIPIIYTNSVSIKNYPQLLNEEFNSIHSGYSLSKYFSNILCKELIKRGYPIYNYILGYIYSERDSITEENSLEGLFTIILKLGMYPNNINFPIRYFHVNDILPELLNFQVNPGTYELYYSHSKGLDELFEGLESVEYKYFCECVKKLFQDYPKSVFRYLLFLLNDSLPELMGHLFKNYGNKLINKSVDENEMISVINRDLEKIFINGKQI